MNTANLLTFPTKPEKLSTGENHDESYQTQLKLPLLKSHSRAARPDVMPRRIDRGP